MTHPQDLMETLAKASTFSKGVPVKLDESIKLSKVKKERGTPKKVVKTDEEQMYSHIIGYDDLIFDDDDDSSDSIFSDFNYAEVNDFENGTVRKIFSGRLHGQNKYKPNDAMKGNNNGIGVGRGRILKRDYISVSLTRRADQPSFNVECNRQGLNDRVIGEQLRELWGTVNSNEAIEKNFNEEYKKPVLKAVTDGRNPCDKDDSSSISSYNSSASSKKSHNSERQLYVPPPLRSRKSVESPKIFDDNKNGDDNLLFSSTANEICEPINLYRHLPPMDLVATKVSNVYDISDDSYEDGGVDKKNENGDSSDEDVKIVETIEHSCDKIPEFGFKVKVKEKEKSVKSGGGRNALINALLKKNADSLAKQSPEPEEKTVNEEYNVNYVKENHSSDKNETNNDVSSNDCSLSYDLSDDGNKSFDCGDFNWISKISNDSENCSSSMSSSRSSLNLNSSPINSTPEKKTFSQFIMDRNKKTRCITLGDFLLPDSLNSNKTSPLNNSMLNPEAPSFLPKFLDNDDDKSGGFNPLDYNNFPPL